MSNFSQVSNMFSSIARANSGSGLVVAPQTININNQYSSLDFTASQEAFNRNLETTFVWTSDTWGSKEAKVAK